MRTLSASLQSAQKKPTSRPHVEAKVYDYAQGIRRLNWTRLYTGAEADNHHGIAFDGQGSMHRIRIDGSDIYHQKTDAIFHHVYECYYGAGKSSYDAVA